MENQKVVITVSDEKEKSKINELVESLGEKSDFIFATKNDLESNENAKDVSSKSVDKLLKEQTNINVGDIVIHFDYGLGRFIGFETIDIGDVKNDFLKIQYADSSLLLPVENIDLITKYCNATEAIKLDKLGNNNWNARKAKAKEKIKNIAEDLIKIASQRKLLQASVIYKNDGEYEDFIGQCGFTETKDQLKAINDIENDFKKGIPMDRLLCGDVGFGKTEVAIRAAFLVVNNKL